MGMKYIVEYLDKQTTPYIWVSHHAVYGTDEYTIPASNAIAMNYLGMNTVPSVVFNRSEQDGLMVIGAWTIENLVVKDDTVAEASVVINHQFDAATRRLDITVSGQVANTDRKAYLLSILIKENGLVGRQEDAFCSWKGAKWQEYMHSRVVRDVVTATFGDTVKVENQAYSYTTTYVLDEEWVPENCCVVAYLTPLEKSPVINAEQVALVAGTEGGEQYGPYGITEGKGPNTSINFDSVRVTRLGDGQLEMMLTSSKTIKTNYFGICKQVGYVCVNTEDSVLQAGVYPIDESGVNGTITAGYRVDEEERLGGSRLLYAVSADLKNGIVTPIHQWRMSQGEMVLDEAGNISLNFTTYNGTSVTATAVYDFSPAATGGVDGVGVLISPEGSNDYSQANLQGSEVQKVLRNGQLLIHKRGECYNILGYKVSE
ncbi:MAG: Omp28-related outer membrane protein [Paludibacteraceae bacterium]|nr:Omp28-related outer membrane protein [Paludibacteraceae bacterium]